MEKLFDTFEACCEAKGYDPKTVIPDLSAFPEELRPAFEAIGKLLIVHHAHKDGHKLNWNSQREYKHYPWWDMEKDKNNPSGFRLYDVGYSYARSGVGSRLCQEKENVAQHIAEKFEPLYRDFMVE